MTSVAQWVSGARPRTLSAAVVPVAIGACVASRSVDVDVTFASRTVAALLVSLALQIAVNFANDYSDGIRGTDATRSGPMRLVGSGVASAAAVKNAAFLSFGVAAVAGLFLASQTTWWLIAVGLASIVAAWTYTGGPRPYGYAGLGEVFVFVFFGLLATAGSFYVTTEDVSLLAVVSGAVSGFLSVALLVVNNIRDIENDRLSGKMTLAVRLGNSRSRTLYLGCYVAAGAMILLAAREVPLALLGLVGLLAALPAVSTVRAASSPRDLVSALGMTSRVQLVVGLLYSTGILLG
ncbi:MAG: 1,4-dihydroxy-2-naphthoate octaprenyltransferase [Actinomycetota bacterium]